MPLEEEEESIVDDPLRRPILYSIVDDLPRGPMNYVVTPMRDTPVASSLPQEVVESANVERSPIVQSGLE